MKWGERAISEVKVFYYHIGLLSHWQCIRVLGGEVEVYTYVGPTHPIAIKTGHAGLRPRSQALSCHGNNLLQTLYHNVGVVAAWCFLHMLHPW